MRVDCYQWDCSKKTPDYEEYCAVKSFLEEAKHIAGKDLTRNHVSLQFRPDALLSHAYTKESTLTIITELNRVKAQLGSFQTELASYHATMASFDKTKAVADFNYFKRLWATQKNYLGTKAIVLGRRFKELFQTAFTVQSANIDALTAQVAMAIASMATPTDAIFNPGELLEKMNTVLDYGAQLANARVNMAHLTYVFRNTLPAFVGLAREIRGNFEGNYEAYQNISRILKMTSTDELTTEDAHAFLKAYNDYSPAITAEQLSRYKVLLDQTVEMPCSIVQGDSQSIKTMTRLLVVKMCPALKQLVEVYKGVLENQAQTQFDIMDSYADIARAKLAERVSSKLSDVFGRGSLRDLEGAIAIQSSQIMSQIHKAQLIAGACDTIKYMNYGQELSFCMDARRDLSLDVGLLVSYDYDQDHQCHASRSRSGIFKIPATPRLGNEPMPEGTLDLTQLSMAKSVPFRIPDEQWLKDHGWISPHESGPFFVKRLDLFKPPSQDASLTVTTTATFALNKNVLNGEEIIFDRDLIATFTSQQNFVNCFTPPALPNPYDMRGCSKFPSSCDMATGEFGPGKIYPSLVGSEWSVRFNPGPQGIYPKTPFYLKVFATICSVKNRPVGCCEYFECHTKNFWVCFSH